MIGWHEVVNATTGEVVDRFNTRGDATSKARWLNRVSTGATYFVQQGR